MFSVTIPEYESKVLNNLIDNEPDKYVCNKPGDTEMSEMLEQLVSLFNIPLINPSTEINVCIGKYWEDS